MTTILGNDISQYQSVDWNTYKNNTNFCILKTSEGVGYTDPKFFVNQSEGRRVGVPLGYYHFARPDLGNSAQSEAEYFLKTVGQLKDGEVLCLDYEPQSQTQSHVTWCKQWLDYVFEKTGVRALIYLNQSQVQRFNWTEVVNGGYGLWIAAYTGSPTDNNATIGQWSFAAMQQWTSSQKVPGIDNGIKFVDGNVFFGDIATFKKYGYKAPAPPTDYKKPYEELLELNKKLSAENITLEAKNAGLTETNKSLKLKIDKALVALS